LVSAKKFGLPDRIATTLPAKTDVLSLGQKRSTSPNISAFEPRPNSLTVRSLTLTTLVAAIIARTK
jgi:hypothetical protein